jgi:hypothetical protein
VIKRHIIRVRKLTEDRYPSGLNLRIRGDATRQSPDQRQMSTPIAEA